MAEKPNEMDGRNGGANALVSVTDKIAPQMLHFALNKLPVDKQEASKQHRASFLYGLASD